MFVKQIDMKTALELAAKGRDISIMAPSVPEPKVWTDYEAETLQGMLEGCLFFRQEPGMEIPIVETGEVSVKGRPADDDSVKRAKRVDRGKLMALHQAGRSNKWIADDMGLHEGTVYRVLREMKEEQGHGETDA